MLTSWFESYPDPRAAKFAEWSIMAASRSTAGRAKPLPRRLLPAMSFRFASIRRSAITRKRNAGTIAPSALSFEDDHLIVVDKSAGTLTVPTDRNERQHAG